MKKKHKGTKELPAKELIAVAEKRLAEKEASLLSELEENSHALVTNIVLDFLVFYPKASPKTSLEKRIKRKLEEYKRTFKEWELEKMEVRTPPTLTLEKAEKKMRQADELALEAHQHMCWGKGEGDKTPLLEKIFTWQREKSKFADACRDLQKVILRQGGQVNDIARRYFECRSWYNRGGGGFCAKESDRVPRTKRATVIVSRAANTETVRKNIAAWREKRGLPSNQNK